MIFPEIFTDPKFEYPKDTKQPHTAVADGLSGWGCCFAGSKPPENFGKGMCEIAAITGHSSSPESLDAQGSRLIDSTR